MTSARRTFLTRGLGAVAVVVGGAPAAVLGQSTQDPSPERRLRDLGLELPPPPAPVATYVTTVRVGDTLYLSGTGPRRPEGGYLHQGKVGQDVSVEAAYEAARLAGLNVLSAVRDALGSLDRVVRLVKVLGMVNASPDFTEHPQVVNGFSDLMVEVFGEQAGTGARSAVGMGSLPFNIPVEIESTFEIRD